MPIIIAIAIVTVIAATSTSPVTAEVVHVNSSLTATGRQHACPEEPLIFTCVVIGHYIQWTFNLYYRTTFLYDDSVNTTRIVSGQYGVQAILTGNDPTNVTAESMSRRLTSLLIIESSDSLSEYLHNITCSSNTETHTQQLKIAETPNKPLNIQVYRSREQLSEYTVTWDPPVNSHKFDLEHFKVYALSEQNSTFINGTTMEPEHRFISDIIPPFGNVHISVSAVSKCSHQGLRSSAIIEWTDGIGGVKSTNVPNTVKTDKDPTALKEYESKDVINCGCKEPITNVHKVLATGVFLLFML